MNSHPSLSANTGGGASPRSAVETNVKTTLELFQQVVHDCPSSEAVVFEERELSYQELDQLADQFAAALVESDVQPGECVGLSIDRCPEAIAAMLGVFRVGAVFVPLDPEYPLDRIQFMVQDADIRVVVTHDKSANPLAARMDALLQLEWVDSCSIEFAEKQLQDVLAQHGRTLTRPQASDLAYIMYTSGSTGNPKGVQIEHAALTAYCMADIEVYRLQASDRTLQFSTLNFDIAIEEIFPPLLIGSCVVVRPSERSEQANELSAIVNQYGITALHLATAYWHEWVDLMKASGDRVPESLRMVLATGEKVSVEHYRRWLTLCDHDVLWCNAYGPTETTVTATVFIPEPDFDEDNMPIGRPLPGYSAFILDDQMKPVAEDATGQLFIGGNALARGYLHRDDLNDKAFREIEIEDEFQRLYATGDLARWLPDGQIEFAGRIDHQIKLGSYRIEPGEIEAAIHKHPDVLESLVVYEMVGTQKFLVAYIATGDKTIRLEELDQFLRESLPPYMVPPRFSVVRAFPKTINGKIDRQALPAASESRTVHSNCYAAPRNDLESRLASIWQDVLNLPQVGIHDDFFALGGSSLLVTRVVTELTNHFGIELPVRDFFANPTVDSSARHIARLLGQNVATEDETGISKHRGSEALRSRLPKLQACFAGTSDRQLFQVHYSPPNDFAPSRRHHGVLLCHAIGHEYTRAYRNIQQLGVQLCEAGFDVLRFDYFGTGNSFGDCDDIRSESLLSDVKRSADSLLQMPGIERFSVVGVRLGATLAANCQFQELPQAGILWDPVIRGQAFLSTLEHLDHYARNSQTRFPRRIPKGAVPQLFGHAWPEEKRSSISRLQLPAEPPVGTQWKIVHSNEYAAEENGFSSCQSRWETLSAADDIRWHSPECTESAFASPRTNQMVIDLLKQLSR